MLESPGTGVILAAALLFAPALAGFAVALQGYDAVSRRLREQSTGEHRQIIARVLLDAVILGYVFALVAALPRQPATFSCLFVAALNLAAAWLFLLNAILDPRPSPVRRYVALAADLALLSILLTIGGPLTAPLVPIYVYHAIGNGERDTPRAMAGAVGLGAVAFAAVVAATPFWREEPLMAAGTLAGMIFLPAYTGSLLHRLAAAKHRAEAANAAKNRALAAFVEELRGPLRAIARAETGGDPATLDPSREDLIGQIRSSARGMLLQLDGLLNYVRLDDGGLAPEARSFDVYQVVNGAVAALKSAAAERNVALNLRIDPAVPPQLHGRPHQLRQILISLTTNAIHNAANATVRINVGAIASAADRVTVRVEVTGSLPDDRIETADQAVAGELDGYPGLPLAERLIEVMGGRLAIETDRYGGRSLAVELPFALGGRSAGLPLDLARTPVLIVTGDSRFASELTDALTAWRAAPRWIGTGENALTYLESLSAEAGRTVLIVDGRYELLPSLGWAHRAAGLRSTARPLYVIFVADEDRIDSVVGLADGELDSILASPFTLGALRGAFHGFEIDSADELSAAAVPPSRAVEAVPERPQAETSKPPKRERRRILIASDSAPNRRIIRSILGQAGHRIELAETVGEARQGLESRAIDVLLLDLTGAPGADYEAARLCRRVRPSLTIVALTKDSAAEAQRRAREIGIDAVVPKPVEPQQLLAFIEAAIEAAARPAATQLPFRVVGNPASYPRFTGEASSAVND
jgi:DNA-binding response OmpR family regulator/signal transduction histidine kinase